MEKELVGLLGLIVLFVLLILRIPVGLAMVGVGIGGSYVLSLLVPYLRFEPYLKQFKTLTWGTVANYDLSVVPLFVFMGFLASYSNLSRDLFRGINAIIGKVRGGVAMAAIGACAGFGAVCGSSLATASTMGKVALPELKKMKYSSRLANGALAAGGTLGILIPPSVALVIYAIIVEGSIVEMFQAAILPGILAVFIFLAVIAVWVKINPSAAPDTEHFTRDERIEAIKRLLPILVIFGGIIMGLSLGLFTPTPAAGVGAFLILAYGLYLRRYNEGLSNDGLKRSILDTAVTASMIYFILFGAEVLKGFFTRSGLPQAIASWAANSGLDPWVILIGMLVIFLILGCFMDSLSMILVVVPFFWPILIDLNGGDWATADSSAYGMTSDDLKIWFGILALVTVELGLITPPVGLNVFIIASLDSSVSMKASFLGVLPFVLAEILRVAILLAIPALTLYLPHVLT
jgi:tripartite ATP-independent transporter DctM subunit